MLFKRYLKKVFFYPLKKEVLCNENSSIKRTTNQQITALI